MNVQTAQRDSRPAWQIVALRELSVKARDKNFLMSLVVTLLLVAGTFGVQIWLSGKTPTSSIAVVTQKNAAGLSGSSLVDAAEKAAKADHDKVEYTSVSASSPADARDAVKAAVMVEDVARTVHIARQLGEPIPIDQHQIDSLYERYQNVYGQ